LAELHVQQAIIAAEMENRSADIHRELLALLSGIEVVKVPHDEFKKITSGEGNIAFVRTGEASPYANVILVSGVTFG
jgi:D-ribose pyranase